MSGLERLLTGEATDFERRLLDAWQLRQPSVEAKVRARELVGVGLGAALLTSTGATLRAATTSIGPKAVGGASVVLTKWIAVGLLGAAATTGAVAYVHHIDRALAKTNEPAPIPRATTWAHSDSVATTPTTTTTTIEPAPVTTPARFRAPATSSARSRKLSDGAHAATPTALANTTVESVSATAETTLKSTLDDEVSMIDRARRSVASGSASTALQIVDAYDTKYPGGALAQESTEIRIESLVAQGDHSTAERLAGQFFAASPSSPYVHRLHKLLGEQTSP
jgi:hypothetical protein